MSIKIDLAIILFIFLFCITSQIEIYLLLMLFAFIHEIGHLIVGVILGFKPQGITVSPVGMKIEFKPRLEEYNQKVHKGNCLAIKRAIVAMAGPITNFIIICILMIAMNMNENLLTSNLCIMTIYANFLIGIFNLIPIYPLDGGRLIKEILQITVGLRKSYTYTYNVAKLTLILLTVIASVAILYIQNISMIIILAYLWGLVVVERKRYHNKMMIMEMKDWEEEEYKEKEQVHQEDGAFDTSSK